MAQDIVTVLKVETGNSEKTIKALKEEIKTLKTTLESAEIGSEAFTQASEQLAAVQAELKTVMDGTKKTVQAADGSYDALVATMAQLKKEWKSTNDEVKRTEIGKEIDEINTQLKELDASIGNSQRNVGNYKQDFVDAMTEMKVQGANFGDELNNINKKTEITRNALDGVGQVASGVASGFAAVQGVSALLGLENENLEKALVKVQSAMAIAQGIGGMKGMVEGAGKLVAAYRAAKMGSAALATQSTITTAAMGTTATATTVATGALQAFKAALISTGIGALIVALGTLIGYLVTLGEKTENVEEGFDDASRAVDDFTNKINRIKNTNDYVINLKIAGGADDDEIWQERIENARKLWVQAQGFQIDMLKAYGEESQQYKDAGKSVKEYNDALTKVKQDYNVWKTEQETNSKKDAEAIRDRALESIIDTKEEELAALYEKYKEEKQLLQQHNLDTNALYQEYLKNKKEIEDKYKKPEETNADLAEAQKIAEEARKAVIDTKQEELAELERIYLERKALLEKEGVDVANLTEAYNINRQEIIDKYDNQEKQKAVDKANFLRGLQISMLTSPDKEIAELETLFEQYKSQYQLNAEELIILEEWKQSELAKIRDKYREEEGEKEWVFLQNMKEDTKELIGNTTQAASAAMSGASQILSDLAANQDKRDKDSFEKAKKLQIASATMNMLAGITAALSGLFTTKTGPWDLVLAGIQASTIAATGAIQISNIKKQQYDGSGGGDDGNLNGAGATPNVSMDSLIPINYTRSVLTDTETTNLNKEQRVYVLESDITETQDNVAIKESNSSF